MRVNSPGPRADRQWPRRHLTRAAAVSRGWPPWPRSSPSAASRQAGRRRPRALERRVRDRPRPAPSSTATASPVTTSGCARGDLALDALDVVQRGGGTAATWEDGRAQAARRRDAAAGHAAAGRGDRRGARHGADGGARSCGHAQSRPAAAAPAQPRRVRQRRPRPAGRRRGREVAAAGRRLGVRLRQQRRSAGGVAVAARAVSRRPPIASARWRSAITTTAPRLGHLSTRAAISRRASIRTACRSAPSAASACATRSRSTASTSSSVALTAHQPRGDPRPRASAPARDLRRRRARVPRHVGGEAEAGQTGTITDASDATDARLRVRVPVKAGPRLVTAAFIRKIAENTNRLRPFLRSNAGTYDSTGRPHVKSLTITGPFNPTGPGDTPSRRARRSVCRPARRAADGAKTHARGAS